jgi:hypothetical protein
MSDTGADPGDDPDGSVVDALRDEVGTALRSVSVYDEDDYEVRYLREDVETAYSPEQIEVIAREVRLSGLSKEYLDGLFDAGELECSLYGFEEAMMFHFVESDFDGLFVTVDRGVGVEPDALIETCKGSL